jgi:deoxyribonuclease V
MDLEKLKEEQAKLAGKVLISDTVNKIERIAGADQAYLDQNTIIGVIVVLDYKTLEILEIKYAVTKTAIQYIPNFLSYREGPAIMAAYSKLDSDFDLMFVEGNGILHPRKVGIASHIGVHISKPTIGVAKSLLCGDVNGNSIYLEKEVVGKILYPHEHTKPLFISPGHLISLQKAYDISKDLIRAPYKLPYPLAIAHKHAAKVKRKLKENTKN